MKVLFCHDGPLRRDEEGNYYGSAHNDKTFRRYYTIGDDLKVAIRVKEIAKEKAEIELSKITVSPFDVIQLPNLSKLNGIFKDRKNAEEKLKKEVVKADYIVARIPSMIGFMGIELAKKLNKPYLVELVTCPWDSYWNHSLKGKLLAPIMFLTTKNYIKDAKFVIYVTNEFLQKRYPTYGRSTNCSNVALNDFDTQVLERRLYKIANFNQEKIILGTTAAVDVKFKGQQYIIKSLGRLKKLGNTKYVYQLVGDGNQKYLKDLAEKFDVSDQVVFLGSIPHEKVFEWLNKVDIYIQPSRQEGLPRALVEAMSQGLPAFGANTAGIPELLDKDFIFSNNNNKNVDEIIQILQNMNKEVLLYQAQRNFQHAMNYDKSIIDNRRREFFEEFTKKSEVFRLI